ncbi:hypothetical protein M407DRAFT_244402 [Tulasnella calospora MUT 4182]|uniref:Uncharacterized protein n=1 Tax=Tulasnella calospora MUT 4182 TaxID=1051891 RepID=A0A0C3QEY2_9AGAM|nr:hypothetical protein M407DRAFT_244402 [Tulasnella calospora MUT 4182]
MIEWAILLPFGSYASQMASRSPKALHSDDSCFLVPPFTPFAKGFRLWGGFVTRVNAGAFRVPDGGDFHR